MEGSHLKQVNSYLQNFYVYYCSFASSAYFFEASIRPVQ